MSQAIALQEYLEKAGHSVEAVYVGCDASGSVPDYFQAIFKKRLHRFFSPYFLRTPNKKGIYVGRTLLFNLLRTFIYLREVRRLRKDIVSLKPDVIFNFYDLVGALAMKKADPAIKRIGIGHHFYLHLKGYPSDGGSGFHRWLLTLHTRLIIKSCDRVLALSYREEADNAGIQVAPPMIRTAYRQTAYRPGNRYLVYLLNGGFLFDLILMARENPDFRADVFTSLVPEMELPPGIQVHPLQDVKFREKMGTCRGLITTAGFDAVAEAAFLGIPLLVIPSQNHFEQRCNSKDVVRSGLGKAVEYLVPGMENQMTRPDNREYCSWVEKAEERIIKSMEK